MADKANPNMSLAEYLQKRKEEQNGFAPDQEDTEAKFWGQANEGKMQKPAMPMFNKVKETLGTKPAAEMNDEDAKAMAGEIDDITKDMHPDNKPIHEGLQKDFNMDPRLAKNVLETYLNKSDTPEARSQYFSEDMNDPDYTEEEKKKIKDFYDTQVQQRDPNF